MRQIADDIMRNHIRMFSGKGITDGAAPVVSNQDTLSPAQALDHFLHIIDQSVNAVTLDACRLVRIIVASVVDGYTPRNCISQKLSS
jgi:hypothetical protein